MKCEYLGGKGVVECDDCNGTGTREGPIQDMKLDTGRKKYDELLQLQEDAKRAIRRCDELKVMLVVTLKKIELEAEKLLKSK